MIALAAAAILLIVGRSAAGVYADYLWYEAVGATALWRARMNAVVALRVGSAAIAGLFAFVNLYAVRQSVVSLIFPRRVANLEIGEEVPGKYLVGAAVALAAILGILLALSSDNWMSFVLARSGTPFNELDPYFGQDLGFFVYWLPFENTLWMWAFLVVVVVSVVVVLLYALTPSLKWQRGGLYASSYVRRHFTVLVGVLLLLLAWSFRLDMYMMLVDGSGADGAFSWVDHRVGVPGDLLLALATLGASAIVLWAGFVGQLRLAAISVLTVVALAVVIHEAAPAVASHNGTEAQRAKREEPYLGTRATYTRRAFEVDVLPNADSTVAFASAAAALPWTPVWDPPALVRAVTAGRSADEPMPLVGWRVQPGGLAADVIDSPPVGASARAPWAATRVLASDADERGAPIRIAGANAVLDESPIDAPLVYPSAPRTTVMADSLNHLAGTPLESFVARAANAWSLQSYRLLAGDQPQPHPTLIAHRDVRDRIDMYAPFFAQGRRVDPILLGDSLYWAVDLYSVADTYPFSRHFLIVGEERSYLHHAATAIVHASTGDVTIVADSVLDPVAASWKTRLPSLFGTWGSLPAGLRAQIPPAIDGLVAQAEAFGMYGPRGGTTPPRHVPVLDGADSLTDPLPIVLPNARSTAVVLPLIDETDRLRGVLIGTGGAAHATAWYGLSAPGPHWNALLDRLRSADSAGGAAREGNPVHGRVRVLPVRGGLAFLQPSYHWRGQAVPALGRVTLLAGDTVRALPLPIGAVQPTPGVPPVVAGSGDFRASVSALYAAMRDALRRGDLVAFGRAFDALGRALAQPGRVK